MTLDGPTGRGLARADLHVHSWHSRASGSLKFLRSRDCYSSPIDVYRVAKARGMDIVTITDHDAIDGWRELCDAFPDAQDILPGEEVSCQLPDGDVAVHLGVYGITERLHREIQPLRRNVYDLAAFLRQSRTFFSFNHPWHFYRGQTGLESYLRLLTVVPALEVRNGAMLEVHNRLAERLRDESRGSLSTLASVAGSDAHTLRRIGATWTEAPGATAAEFLLSLSKGLGAPRGAHGGTAAVAADTYGVVARYAASIYGYGLRDHAGWDRALCAAFVAASLPIQFLPLAIAAIGKSRERRTISTVIDALGASPQPSASIPQPATEPQP